MKRGKAEARERGQALILIVLAVAGLLGLTALAVDGSHVFAQRRQAQNAADTAAFAAAIEKINAAAPGNNWAGALARAASNSFADDTSDYMENAGQTVDVIVLNPPDSTAPAAYVGNSEYVQVKINANIGTFFAKVVGVSSLPIHVQAVAKALPPHSDDLGGNNGIVALGNVCNAVRTHGNGHTTLTGGGVYSNSGAPTNPSGGQCYAFNAMGGSDQITADSATMVGCLDPNDVSGGKITFNPGTYTCSQAPIGYPPPPPDLGFTCDDLGVGTRSLDGKTVTPGRWSRGLGNLAANEIFPPTANGPGMSPVDTIEAGVYCITGHFNIGSTDSVSSTGGVTFILDGDLNWNASAQIDFVPSSSGTIAGLLIYRPLNNLSGLCDDGNLPGTNACQTLSFNGGADSHWSGTIYAPDSECFVDGGSGSVALNAQAICYVVDIGGNSTLDMTYDGSNNWEFPYPPETELNR